MQPMVAFKNALQEGRPMPTAPKALYRGLLVSLLGQPQLSVEQSQAARMHLHVHRCHTTLESRLSLPWCVLVVPMPVSICQPLAGPLQQDIIISISCIVQINAASIAPITASQFGTHRILEQALIKASGGKEPTSLGRFGCAAGAGAVSAMICTPTELIIIQQQVHRHCSQLNCGTQYRETSGRIIKQCLLLLKLTELVHLHRCLLKKLLELHHLAYVCWAAGAMMQLLYYHIIIVSQVLNSCLLLYRRKRAHRSCMK